MRLISIVFSLFLIVSCSSKDDPGCFVSDVDFTNLEAAHDCEDTEITLQIDLTNTYTLIENQTDYDAMVVDDCNPTIDFETYTLIIGKQGLSSGNASISYDYTLDCSIDTYSLTVTFNQNETTEAPNLTYHILSPKINENDILLVQTVIN